MAHTAKLPDCHCPKCSTGFTSFTGFTREQTSWAVFDQSHEYCGQIQLIRAWAIPAEVYKPLGLPNHLDLFLTSKGHWAPTLEIAEHLLINTEAPQEFIVRGNTLSLFVPPQWFQENGTPNTYRDYRVLWRDAGYWDAEEIEEALVFEDFEQFEHF